MAHKFEIAQETEVDATPEQVWEAVASGPGWDSWFMGRNEIEQRQGGAVRWSIGDFTATSTVTTWDPPKRFASSGDEAPDGSLHHFDYRIEPREGGGSSIRYLHSGFLGGDWEAEYEAMREGDPMYFQKLAEYVTYFSGRFATSVDAHGPEVADREQARNARLVKPHAPPDWEQRFRKTELLDAVIDGEPIQMFVMAADIRESTMLMKEAITFGSFALVMDKFVTSVRRGIRRTGGW